MKDWFLSIVLAIIFSGLCGLMLFIGYIIPLKIIIPVCGIIVFLFIVFSIHQGIEEVRLNKEIEELCDITRSEVSDNE